MNQGEQWGPIVMDISFDCDICKANVRGRITVYHDATYITCQAQHHHTYNSPQEVPNMMGWISHNFSDTSDEC